MCGSWSLSHTHRKARRDNNTRESLLLLLLLLCITNHRLSTHAGDVLRLPWPRAFLQERCTSPPCVESLLPQRPPSTTPLSRLSSSLVVPAVFPIHNVRQATLSSSTQPPPCKADELGVESSRRSLPSLHHERSSPCVRVVRRQQLFGPVARLPRNGGFALDPALEKPWVCGQEI